MKDQVSNTDSGEPIVLSNFDFIVIVIYVKSIENRTLIIKV